MSFVSDAAKWARWAVGRENAADVISANEKQIEQLRKEYDEQARMVEQLKANAVRLTKAKQMAAARTALAHMKEAETAMNQTSGKMATLQAQTNNLRGLDSNVKMHESIKRGNAVTERVGSSLTPDEVHDTMDKALALKEAHREVGETLAGNTYLDPIDEDDADAELAALAADPENAVYEGEGPTVGVGLGGNNNNAYVSPVGAMNPLPTQAELARQRADELRREAEMLERLQAMPAAPRYPVGQVPPMYAYNAPAATPSPVSANVFHYHSSSSGGGQK